MKLNQQQLTDINNRLQEAIKLLNKDTTNLEKFYSIQKLIRGLDKKTDKILDEIANVASRLQKLQQGKYVDIVFEKLIEINKDSTSILLVEQNARMALEIAHRGYVFKIGKIFLEDTGKNLLENSEVKKAFLGR